MTTNTKIFKINTTIEAVNYTRALFATRLVYGFNAHHVEVFYQRCLFIL